MGKHLRKGILVSQTPFMPLWVSDFLGDTLDLDAAEIGAYMLLLMAQWNRGGNSLPNDEKKLQRVARCGRNWGKVWANISRFFEVDESGVYSKRLRLESQNVAAKRLVNKHNGARGGRAKALKSNNAPLANATDSLERNASIPEPEREKEEGKPSSKKAQGKRLPDDWVLPDNYGQWALGEGWPESVIRSESEKFKDYWHSLPGAKARKVDWLATWRNWMRNSKSPKAITGGRNDKPTRQSERLNAFIAGARSTS